MEAKLKLELKSESRSLDCLKRKGFPFYSILIGILLNSSCAHLKVPTTHSRSTHPVPSTVTNPTEKQTSQSQQTLAPNSTPIPSPTPTPLTTENHLMTEPRPIVLVLGPGMARGYAYAGVIRELSQQKIPIAAIIGTEMGGLIGALYASSGSLNQFEWNLQKFKAETFLDSKGIFEKITHRPSDGKQLENQLQKVFGGKDLKDSKIPLKIVIQSKDSGIPIIIDQGKAVQAIRSTLAIPSLYTPGWMDTPSGDLPMVAANSTCPFAVSEARNLGLGPVVVINVLKPSESISGLKQLKDADLVIRPDLKGFNYMDFQRKTEIAFLGKSAVANHIHEIHHLMAMPLNTQSEQQDKRSHYP